MENAWAVYLALLSWIYFYVIHYDTLAKRSHKFLIQLSGYTLIGLSLLITIDIFPDLVRLIP